MTRRAILLFLPAFAVGTTLLGLLFWLATDVPSQMPVGATLLGGVVIGLLFVIGRNRRRSEPTAAPAWRVVLLYMLNTLLGGMTMSLVYTFMREAMGLGRVPSGGVVLIAVVLLGGSAGYLWARAVPQPGKRYQPRPLPAHLRRAALAGFWLIIGLEALGALLDWSYDFRECGPLDVVRRVQGCAAVVTLQDAAGSLALTPDGRTLAVGSVTGDVLLYALSDRTLRRTLQEGSGWIESVAVAPQGDLLAAGTRDGTIRLWRLTDGALLQTLSGFEPVFSPDGTRLATSADETLRIWSVADGQPLQTLVRPGGVGALAFTPDGKQLVVAGGAEALVQVLDSGTGSVLREFRLDEPVSWTTLSPDGSLIATADADGGVQLWRVADGAPVRRLADAGAHALYMAFNHDSTLLAVAGGYNASATVWRVADGAVVRTFAPVGWTDAITFMPDGAALIVGGYRRIDRWQLR